MAFAKNQNTVDDGLKSELAKKGIVVTTMNDLYNWGRRSSIWPMQFGLACCAIEMIATACARYDIARFGAELFRPSPRQSDLIIIAGTVTKKMAPQVVRLYNQMAEPKYVITMGACSIAGGPFIDGYNVLRGIDRYIPVDVHLPGCPPRPEALLYGLMELQKKIDSQEIETSEWYQKGLKREYPVPEFGPYGLIPKYNPDVWNPRKVDYRKDRYGEPILIGKKTKAPNLDIVAAPKPAPPPAPPAPPAAGGKV
ncbi:MAG: NADH-quinone oxidoreductase subunit B [Candidatus Omnitrophica bacterium]|nr:NADH-quinone oxidoreductase subunit B [Candidatus Omnitrophota bacterium]